METHQHHRHPRLPPSVVDVFRIIVKENHGIRLEDLLPEYEVRQYAYLSQVLDCAFDDISGM